MLLKFPADFEVPDPISIDASVLTIGRMRFCAFTGLPVVKCECWIWAPDADFPHVESFIDYVTEARKRPNSLFTTVVTDA